ncbi:MAG: hypothetical protein N5P05_000742 [Chroococcopsis gigantea SAG 12.99]|jgi:hypothetical protein|nr:DUF4334 domain-containing protein [Chlorogloea purpurea SAG 13.99]MDV2999136.1 hypothetical protein [Chroococcopsis gigantea SAG 12.99]
MENFANPLSIIESGRTTTVIALELFDRLESVDIDFMQGRWRGSEFPTEHPVDGLLEILNWYGKEFVNSEIVHPLLFLDERNQIFKVVPYPFLINFVAELPMFKDGSLKGWLPYFRPLLLSLNSSLMRTEQSQAQLKMVEYRGRVTTGMIYDYLPIVDYFKKINETTVLGLMDWKKLPQPFFFILKKCGTTT